MSICVDDFCSFINAAFANMDENSSEIIHRSYINRSYYAIFHNLRLVMNNAGIATDKFKTGSHQNLFYSLDELAKNDKNLRKIAIKYRNFLTLRHKADYALDDDIEWHDVKQVQKYLDDLPSMIATHIK
ncbi:hypothetical protein [Moraxella canis]|uniref:hypothetical protein n=1 Tax=Moraxella canis TaxID=90239 RepID=UPI0006688B94|nr:hypothetical protein [Moraxella canis]